MDKPVPGVAVVYAELEIRLADAVDGISKEYPLPAFMISAAVDSVAEQYRKKADVEAISAMASYSANLDRYYKSEIVARTNGEVNENEQD